MIRLAIAFIVQEYGRYYEEDSRGSLPQITQSATNLTVVEKLAEVVGRLASVLGQLLVEKDFDVENALSYTKRKVVSFRDKDCVDLYDFLSFIIRWMENSVIDDWGERFSLINQSKAVY